MLEIAHKEVIVSKKEADYDRSNPIYHVGAFARFQNGVPRNTCVAFNITE